MNWHTHIGLGTSVGFLTILLSSWYALFWLSSLIWPLFAVILWKWWDISWFRCWAVHLQTNILASKGRECNNVTWHIGRFPKGSFMTTIRSYWWPLRIFWHALPCSPMFFSGPADFLLAPVWRSPTGSWSTAMGSGSPSSSSPPPPPRCVSLVTRRPQSTLHVWMVNPRNIIRSGNCSPSRGEHWLGQIFLIWLLIFSPWKSEVHWIVAKIVPPHHFLLLTN